jgi:DNA-binding transcriptional regulator LsrR (DeoR family)
MTALGIRRRGEATRLRVEEGLSNLEIAERMGISTVAAASLLHRARRIDGSVPRDPYMEDRRGALAA